MTAPAGTGSGVRVEKVVTSGTFSLDGGTWDVDNNVWLVGNDDEVVVIDAAHDATAIVAAVGTRRVIAIVLTHGHDDHIGAAGDLAQQTGAKIWLHPDDRMLWDNVYAESTPDEPLLDGHVFEVAGIELHAVHTPGHSPGSTSLHAPELETVFTGDTLFQGGPGATGRSYSDFDLIIRSIAEQLLTLPPQTVVHTGHGDDTTIGSEAPALPEWIKNGA